MNNGPTPNTDLNNIAEMEKTASENQGTSQNPIQCTQCLEYSVIESVCSDGCDNDWLVQLEIHSEHTQGGFNPQDCPCDECLAPTDTEQPNRRTYEIDEIGSVNVVNNLEKSIWSWAPSLLAASFEAERFGDRPIISHDEIEYLAEFGRGSVAESLFENLDLGDEFSELDSLNHKEIISEAGIKLGLVD